MNVTDLAEDLSSLDLDDTENKCAHCHKPDAKFYCAGCRDTPSVHNKPQSTAVYCNKECQKAGWASHRKSCKNLQARKALFRAAYLIQAIWYAVRRESFDCCVIKAEEVDGELIIHEGAYNTETTKRERGFYRDFPVDVFVNEQDAEACLNLLYCGESLAHMAYVNAWLLNCICKEVTECTVMITKPARLARYADKRWNQNYVHEILKATLPSGEAYAIDLTGAQYGWYDPITYWPSYLKRGIQVARDTPNGPITEAPLGFAARRALGTSFDDPNDDRQDFQRAVPLLGECLKREFHKEFVQQIIKQYPDGGMKLLKLPTPAFEAAKKHIVATAQQITHRGTEKCDAVQDIVHGEARAINQDLIQKPEVAARGTVLKVHLKRLAAFFNGEWSRDAETGRLVSDSLDRLYSNDAEWREKAFDGVLPEQQAWGGEFNNI